MARRILRALIFLAWLPIFIGVAWAFGALWFDLPLASLRHSLAVAFACGAVAAFIFVRPRWRAQLGIGAAIGVIAGWWFTLQPAQNRDWKPEVAVLPHATINGEHVTIEGVRNFDYRTETDFTPKYDTRTYDLGNLRGVDIFANYWGSAFMAHPIFSFDFGDDGRICFSIETRPVRGQSFSALGGLYRQFEIIYIAADERDVIRVRTNYRKGEDVYLYRLKFSPEQARASFLEYIHTLNLLHGQPRWYNAITDNCTSAIRQQRTASERWQWDWRMLANGYGDQLLYEHSAIDTSLPFAELKRRSLINKRAKAANDAPDFSARIRNGLPGFNNPLPAAPNPS